MARALRAPSPPSLAEGPGARGKEESLLPSCREGHIPISRIPIHPIGTGGAIAICIGEGVHFQIGPDVLDRVEFRRVSGQEEWMQMIGTFHKVSRAFGAVGIEAIPE